MKMRGLALLPLLAATTLLPPLTRAQVPAFAITPEQSSIKFYVNSSIDISGKFDKWDAALTFTSPDITTGVLDIKIQAASVDTVAALRTTS
jgi:polyisoprenoid-binding protein YceI